MLPRVKTYVLRLCRNDWILRKWRPSSLHDMALWACARVFPQVFRFYRSGTYAHARARSLGRVGPLQLLAIFGAQTIDCTWQSASRHGVKKALKNREPEDVTKMSESGNQESAATPNDTGRPPRPSVGNQVTVVLGAQWGDEGKGKVVDLLAQDADMVCRCQVG